MSKRAVHPERSSRRNWRTSQDRYTLYRLVCGVFVVVLDAIAAVQGRMARMLPTRQRAVHEEPDPSPANRLWRHQHQKGQAMPRVSACRLPQPRLQWMAHPRSDGPPKDLVGHSLGGGWIIIERVPTNPRGTGGAIGFSYVAEEPRGRRGLVKALDFSGALYHPSGTVGVPFPPVRHSPVFYC